MVGTTEMLGADGGGATVREHGQVRSVQTQHILRAMSAVADTLLLGVVND